MRLGVDTGGTFTDFVLLDDQGRLAVHKVLSTPDAPERAILDGIEAMGLAAGDLQLVHGSTVATNAVLEGKGVETLYVTNRGFADLLTIGRQQRSELYDLQPSAVEPPVPADHCVETGGRIGADGGVIEPLVDQDLEDLIRVVHRLQPQAVAINLLFSYLDDRAEQRLASVLPPETFISLSSQVLPEIREYERGMATWLNAWVGPRVAGYLQRLRRHLAETPVSVMQSAGDTVAAEQAAGQAVRMLLSGPAGGLIAAQCVAGPDGAAGLLTFDMGGTSTDVALVDGVPMLTTEGRVGPYPVAVPMVDMQTIGAGGGSIAWLDPGGMLQVGPQSAGADPGPACYGRGGDRPTVTDANLVLGRLPESAFLGGDMALDREAGHRAVASLAQASGQSVEQAALDIVAVANEHMAQALRAVAIKRGVDPRDHVLLSFGGAGGLHVCALADALDISRAMVPMHGGVLSALGMLASRPGRQLSRSRLGRLDSLDEAELEQGFASLANTGLAALAEEGLEDEVCTVERSADLRYEGQSYTLNLPWQGRESTETLFHERHEARYGHRLALPVELVNLRVAVRGPEQAFEWPALEPRPAGEPFEYRTLVGVASPVPVYWRGRLAAGQRLVGPALICEQVATTWLSPGWELTVDNAGHLALLRLSARA
jgi:N-methylhydantoinase A